MTAYLVDATPVTAPPAGARRTPLSRTQLRPIPSTWPATRVDARSPYQAEYPRTAWRMFVAPGGLAGQSRVVPAGSLSLRLPTRSSGLALTPVLDDRPAARADPRITKRARSCTL